MSYSDGRIYTSGDYGVSVYDVQQVLGETSNDVGTLCTSENINKWSKYKPFVSNSIAFKSDTNSSYNDRITALKAANFGFTIPYNSYTSETIIDHISEDAWVYNQPTGRTSSPFRLTDFNNYYHDAEPPFYMPDVDNRTISLDSTGSGSITFTPTENEEEGGVKFSDFNSTTMVASKLHYAAIVVCGTEKHVLTSEDNLASSVVPSVTFSVSNLTESKTYQVYHCLAREDDSDSRQYSFIPMPISQYGSSTNTTTLYANSEPIAEFGEIYIQAAKTSVSDIQTIENNIGSTNPTSTWINISDIDNYKIRTRGLMVKFEVNLRSGQSSQTINPTLFIAYMSGKDPTGVNGGIYEVTGGSSTTSGTVTQITSGSVLVEPGTTRTFIAVWTGIFNDLYDSSTTSGEEIFEFFVDYDSANPIVVTFSQEATWDYSQTSDFVYVG